MAVTRLKRKDRRNKARAANRNSRLKQLTSRPVIKKLDVTTQPVATKEEKAPVPEEKVAAQSKESAIAASKKEKAVDAPDDAVQSQEEE